MSSRISVIGLGEVGTPTFEDLCKKIGSTREIVGVDIDSDRLEGFKRKGYEVAPKAPVSDVYIISVYLTRQIFNVLETLDLSRRPLVSIESTIDVREAPTFRTWAQESNTHLVTVPHRFVPNDPAHRVFNLNRVLGGVDKASTNRGMNLYEGWMEPPAKVYEASSFEYAGLSKLVDNATRYAQISWAQNLRMYLEELGYDFNEIRRLTGTKFNIVLPDARDGIKLKCLPKDMAILRDLDPTRAHTHTFKPKSDFIADMIDQNEFYKHYAKAKGFPKTPDL
ncbi:MAG: hypothetical protein AABY01_00260 [Nanoarchaeota archaeon]